MIARWRELGLVAGPEWRRQFEESKGLTVVLDEPTAQWVRFEAARRERSASEIVGEVLAERLGARQFPATLTA